jgi:hypothetical protein
MKAHDVRDLCLCPVCGKLGDDRKMVKAGLMMWLAHDRCVFEQLGEGILNLPKDQVHLGNRRHRHDEEVSPYSVSSSVGRWPTPPRCS